MACRLLICEGMGSDRSKRTFGKAGFTLLEIMVTSGIVGALAAITFPGMAAGLNAHRLTAGLRETVGIIRVARSSAISRNVQGRVVVSEDGTTLTVQVNRAGTWTAIGTPVVLDGGVAVSSVTPSNGLLFTTQGAVANAVIVTVHNGRGDTRQISVSLLGSVDIA